MRHALIRRSLLDGRSSLEEARMLPRVLPVVGLMLVAMLLPCVAPGRATRLPDLMMGVRG